MADFINDLSGRHLLRISTLLDAPDYVKSATVSIEEVQALPDNAFALRGRREFPIDTPGHVWLGYAYAKSAGIDHEGLVDQLRNAGRLLGIEADLKAFDDAFDATEKQASTPAEQRWAVSVDFGEPDPGADSPLVKAGGVRGFYPINDPEQVVASAYRLSRDRHLIPEELHAVGCRNLCKAAAEMGMDLNRIPKSIQQYGADRCVSVEVLEHFAEQRHQTTGDDTYLKIAASVRSGVEDRPLSDWAELWLAADRLNGVEKTAGEPDPFEIFNSGPSREAQNQEIEQWVAIAGAPVPRAKVAAVQERELKRWFSAELTEKLLTLVKRAEHENGTMLTAAFSELDEAVSRNFVRRVLLA